MEPTSVESTEAAAAATSTDPAVGLRAVRALRRLTERLESAQVAQARAAGWSWQQIADALGVSRQAAHKKHSLNLIDRDKRTRDKQNMDEQRRRKAKIVKKFRRTNTQGD